MTAIKDEPFGPYELLARLGDGPRGPVAVARAAAADDAQYMIEVSAFASDEADALRGYLHDVERAARIKHRNVLAIVDVGATTAGRYVVMPYVDGCTLTDIQARHRAIRPPRLVLAAVIDALHGLHAAHAFRSGSAAQPLLHGSLSPDELWLGVDGACRVGGFGHARRAAQASSSRRRAAGQYLAPEQVNGEPTDHRTDLFALGIVLWNALTGKRLFHDRIEHMTLSNVLERKIPRPSAIGLSPPPALDAIVMKALERDPERRFQGAAEMAGALQDAARGASCLAPATELGEWIATTFGGELAARRHALRELCARPNPRGSEAVVLPRLVAPAGDPGRDDLSLEELSRANDAPAQPLDGKPDPLPLTPQLESPAPPRRRLALVAGAAFSVVAGVLGWRWSTTDQATPPHPGGMHVTVVEVRSVGRPAAAKPTEPAEPTEIKPAPAASTAAEPPSQPRDTPSKPAKTPSQPGDTPSELVESKPVETPPRSAETPPRPATRATPAVAPARTVQRMKRTTRPAPTAAKQEPPDKPAEPPKPVEPPRPDSPPRPTLESNPYIYNK